MTAPAPAPRLGAAMLALRYTTPKAWVDTVLDDLDAFLQDHAANEHKVCQAALQLVRQHPGRRTLARELTEVAVEELDHFQRVLRLLHARDVPLAQDAPDPYMTALRRALRKAHVDPYLMDRLILFAIVEARGCERFALLADALRDPALRDFYREVTRSEARHRGLYLRLARRYFPAAEVHARLDELLDLEAEVARALPRRPALH